MNKFDIGKIKTNKNNESRMHNESRLNTSTANRSKLFKPSDLRNMSTIEADKIGRFSSKNDLFVRGEIKKKPTETE